MSSAARPDDCCAESPSRLPANLNGQVLLKCGDKITTDHIMPAGAF